MTMKQILQLLLAFAVLSLPAACAPAGGPSPDTAERHPFSLHTASEDGTQVHWEAPSDGYQPGESETMHLAISNHTGQSWHGRLCVQLLEPSPSSKVLSLAEQAFTLESGLGFDDTLSIVMPVELQPGTYGLALVVHRPAGPAASVVSIQVGNLGQEGRTNPWPTEAALQACPPPASSN